MRRAEPTVKGKALLMTLYESAARPEELSNLQWSCVEYQEHDVTKLFLYSNKTERARVVYVQEATRYLKQWEAEYVIEDRKGSDYVFPSHENPKKPMCRYVLVSWLKRLSKKAGLEREIYPYLLRHSRLTELMKLIKDQVIHREFAGHVKGGKSTDLYVHLSAADVEETMLKHVFKIPENPPDKKKDLAAENEQLRAEINSLKVLKEEWELFKRQFPYLEMKVRAT